MFRTSHMLHIDLGWLHFAQVYIYQGNYLIGINLKLYGKSSLGKPWSGIFSVRSLVIGLLDKFSNRSWLLQFIQNKLELYIYLMI